MTEAETPGAGGTLLGRPCEACTLEIHSSHPKHAPLGGDARHDGTLVALDRDLRELVDAPAKAANTDPGGQAADDDGTDRRETKPHAGELAPSATAELIAVPPGRELRTKGCADPHEIDPVIDPREPNLICCDALFGIPIAALAFLDRLPALLDRSEIPSLAAPAHDPQTPKSGIKSQAPPYGKMLDRLVRTEWVVTEEAGGVHTGNIAPRQAGDKETVPERA